MAAGPYIPEREGLEADGMRFMMLVIKAYSGLIGQLSREPKSHSSRRAGVKIHRQTLGQDPFLKMWNTPGTSGSESTAHASHSTCFSCLFSAPNHALDCGHVMCDVCVDDFSEYPPAGQWRTVTECPLCCSSDPPWNKLLIIKRNPRQAGPRILSLDGYVDAHVLLYSLWTGCADVPLVEEYGL